MAKDWGTQFDPVVKTLTRKPVSYATCRECNEAFEKGDRVVQVETILKNKHRYHYVCWHRRSTRR